MSKKYQLMSGQNGCVQDITADNDYSAVIQAAGAQGHVPSGSYRVDGADGEVIRLILSETGRPWFLLNKPEQLELEENEISVCQTFCSYARAMQYPEPTELLLPISTEVVMALAINRGILNCREAYKACEDGYEFTDSGRECIRMKTPSQVLETMTPTMREQVRACYR